MIIQVKIKIMWQWVISFPSLLSRGVMIHVKIQLNCQWILHEVSFSCFVYFKKRINICPKALQKFECWTVNKRLIRFISLLQCCFYNNASKQIFNKKFVLQHKILFSLGIGICTKVKRLTSITKCILHVHLINMF